METADTAFTGSIPELYDRCLGPFLFEPYADDLAARAAAVGADRILETAAGTGIVTQALAKAMPRAEIVATDLNPAMLAVAERRVPAGRASFRQADAEALPFEAASFDLIVCQFGAMFFPDRILAYREARRALRPGGVFLFNVWDRLDANPASAAAGQAVAALFPDAPPSFLERVPFGYGDKGRVEADLRAAGFRDIASETVVKRSHGPALETARGLCLGSPLRAEIEARAPERLDEAVEAAAAALVRLSGGEEVDAAMSAHVFTASG